MNLRDVYSSNDNGFQEVSQDNSQPRLGDLRKTKLTLKQINKLRKLNDIRQFEFKQEIENIKKQYSPPPQPAI